MGASRIVNHRDALVCGVQEDQPEDDALVLDRVHRATQGIFRRPQFGLIAGRGAIVRPLAPSRCFIRLLPRHLSLRCGVRPCKLVAARPSPDSLQPTVVQCTRAVRTNASRCASPLSERPHEPFDGRTGGGGVLKNACLGPHRDNAGMIIVFVPGEREDILVAMAWASSTSTELDGALKTAPRPSIVTGKQVQERQT